MTSSWGYPSYIFEAQITMKEWWALLKEHKQRLEDEQAPAMIAGPFQEEGAYINCVLKHVPDPAKRLPDELHRGIISASATIDGIRIRCFIGQFPSSSLFKELVYELVGNLEALTVLRDDFQSWVG